MISIMELHWRIWNPESSYDSEEKSFGQIPPCFPPCRMPGNGGIPALAVETFRSTGKGKCSFVFCCPGLCKELIYLVSWIYGASAGTGSVCRVMEAWNSDSPVHVPVSPLEKCISDSKSVKDRPYGIDVLLFILTRSKIMIKILLIGARRWMFGSASSASLAWNGGKSGVWVRRKPD